MNQTLVTQTAAQPVLAALTEVASNLAAHANASISKAHGINMLQFAPNSINDGSGNDISVYYDDHGDVIGTIFVTFVINDTVYYAPALVTTLPGQALSTGQGVYGASAPSAPASPGTTDNSATWITDVISQETSAVNAINNSVLIPHTQDGYWEVHDSMTAIAFNTYDSIGHLIGDHVIILYWGGNTYQIPCSTRLGGPLQPPWSVPFSPVQNAFWVIGPDDNTTTFDYTVYASGTNPNATPWSMCGGNQPLTLTWYAQDDSGAWNVVASGQSTIPFSNASTTVVVQSNSNSFTFYQGGEWTSGFTKVLNVKFTLANDAATLDPAGLFTFTVYKNTNY